METTIYEYTLVALFSMMIAFFIAALIFLVFVIMTAITDKDIPKEIANYFKKRRENKHQSTRCTLFHKWSKWKQFIWEYHREFRICERCGTRQERKVKGTTEHIQNVKQTMDSSKKEGE